MIRSFKRLILSQMEQHRSGFSGRRRLACSSPAHQAEKRLNGSSRPILVARVFTELLPQLPFLSPDEKIDQRNMDGGDDECGR